MSDEAKITDFLTEAEVDFINRLRGYTEEGDDIGTGWGINVAFLAGRWRVTTYSPEWSLYGEGHDFSFAWGMQADPRLSAPAPEMETTDHEPVIAPPPKAPRLRLIAGTDVKRTDEGQSV